MKQISTSGASHVEKVAGDNGLLSLGPLDRKGEGGVTMVWILLFL